MIPAQTDQMIQDLSVVLTQIKELVSFLLTQPVFVLALGFVVMAIVIYEVLRKSDLGFSGNSSLVLAVIMAFFGASTVAIYLEDMGLVLAYIVVVGVPAAVGYGLIRRNRSQKIANE